MVDYIIYTDGGYSSSSNVGSAAYVILQSDEATVLRQNSFVLRNETSQRAELKAILAAIDALPDRCRARVCTDCLAATLSLGRPPRRKHQPDADLLLSFKQLVKRKKLMIEFQWVRSHGGAPWQEHCDNLCTETLAEAESIDPSARG
ncbi:MAG: reverse transcriptase-like protein [Bacteroidales bacterium]|nr:reverse transcriptase-like protein [Bacteroidales bacterium]MBR0083736.1 reverse transcriptase-like protein [Bacteroidales bacterium]MBR0291052.1 reverse transcriptase-like protein [Bacteroidales bacterium]